MRIRTIGRLRALTPASSGGGQVATPTFSPVAGSYGPTQNVTISSSSTPDAIYYTTDGSTPTNASTLYTGPVAVASSLTLKALAVKSGFTDSAIGSAAYTINGAVATPTFDTVTAGTYAGTQSVTLACATSGASIYYTTDGSTPDNTKTLYVGAISVTASETIKAIGIKAAFSNSSVLSGVFYIFPKATMLLHMDGTNGGTTFTDSSSNAFTITTHGGIQTSTAQQKYGTASALFNGTNAYLTSPSNALFGYGTGDFFISFWLRPTTLGTALIWDQRTTNPQLVPTLYFNTNVLDYNTNGSDRITGTTLTTGAWSWVTLNRVSGVTTLYVNGAAVGSPYTDANSYITTSVTLGTYVASPSSFYSGYMDDAVCCKGTGLTAQQIADLFASSVAYPN